MFAKGRRLSALELHIFEKFRNTIEKSSILVYDIY